jgi:DNA-binding NtrC family response regulator
MISGTLLIVDENKSDRNALELILRHEVENIISIASPNRINEILSQSNVDIVLLEMNFKAKVNTGNEGLFWMNEIIRIDSSISVIMITSNGDVELAVKAIREGAIDFIIKPFDNNKLITSIYTAWKFRISRLETSNLIKDNLLLKKEINKGGQKIVCGASPTMINVMNIIRKVAGTDANVLITGENGTGK